MSDVRADSSARGSAPRPPPGRGRWPLSLWLSLIALVFAAHIVSLYLFGARKPIVPRAVTGAVTLKLADRSDEFLALHDPTLFALPHPGEFEAATWPPAPVTNRPAFGWTEPPRWLPLSTGDLLTVFSQFMRTNLLTGLPLQLRPPVRLSVPPPPAGAALAQESTMRIEGDLTQRRLLTPMELPVWPLADVIAPSKVEALVNEAGDVVFAVLLPSDNSREALSHNSTADQRALEFARAARFAPAPRLTMGHMIINWHTVPPPATNLPSGAP
jgi:hypothetical protein